jgi:5'-nucleotidase
MAPSRNAIIKGKRLLPFFVLNLFMLFLISCVACPYSTSGNITPPAPKHFILAGTADLQGTMDAPPIKNGDEEHPVGGISRIAVLFKLMKSAIPGHVITVSTGDDLMGTYFHVFNGKAIFTLMSRAGYDIFAPGNHEFDKGPAVFADALKAATFQPLCSNLSVKNTPLQGKCEPYLLKDFDGVTFGFFSLITENLPYVTSAAPVRLKEDNTRAAKRMIALLKQKGADIIVALTHIGTQQDRKLASHVPGIDIIFGGHSHDYLEKPIIVGKTLIVNGGEKGAYLVKLDFFVTPNGKIIPERTLYTLIPVNRALKPDPEIDALLATYRKSLPEAIVLGTTDKPWDLSKKAVRQSESSVADLINDLLKDKFKADVVLNNSGAFRGKKIYPAGKITDVMLQQIDEFRNYAYTLEIRGKYIRQILEWSASSYGRGGFMQVAGLRYTIDLNGKKQALAKDAAGHLKIVTPGTCVKQIEIQDRSGVWKPLNPEKSYKILTNSFLVDKEGDGYFWFKKYAKKVNNTFSTFYSILTEYVQKHKKVSPPDLDGRIKILGKS